MNKHQQKTKTPKKTMSAPPVRWKKRVDDALMNFSNNDEGSSRDSTTNSTATSTSTSTTTASTVTRRSDNSSCCFSPLTAGLPAAASTITNHLQNDDDGGTRPKRSWTAKRILSNNSYWRENPDSFPLVTADSADSNNNIVSNDDIKKEDVVVDEGDGSENDSPTITKKKSYKVKRIISTDSFKRENPGVAFNGSSTSLDLNDVKGSQHSVGINDGNNDDDTDQKPRRSWNVKRIMTQDSFARENPDHHFFASKRSLGSNDSHSSILSTSLHGESGSQCRFMSRSSSSSSLHEIDVGGHRVKAMQQLLQHRWSSAQRLGEERPTLKSKSAHNTLWRNKADTSTTRRIGDAASESNRHLMTTKTSHPPLKKYTFLKSQDEHPQAASQKKTKWNSRHSEASSACGLDFGTTHSVTSFASSCESGLEEDDIQTDTDQPNSTHCDIPPHTPQSSLQKKVGLANRISQFEEMNDNIESKNQAGSILSPRYLEPKDKFQPSRSTYGKSPGSLRAMTKNRFVRIGASMTSDAQPTDDDRETASPGVSNSATATTKGSQSLRDKISMFNKAGTLPEFMTVFGSTSPSIGQKKLIAKPASLSSSSSKRELRRSSALGHIKGESSLETSLLELLPPPKNSLDVKNNQRKSDKTNGSVANSESHESFGRRVRLKSTKSALVGKNNQSKRNIFTAIAAPKIDDLTDFQPPEFEKDRDSIQQIDSALRKNFVFNEMNEDERERFVKAFEEVVFEKGQIIIKQGDVGDYFYVIASGEVSYEVNKKNVGSAASGDSFGELSLLYTCPRNASVIAESPSTRLFRVDQRTFRFMMQSQTNDLEESKKKLLRGIKFLEHLSDEDLVRLSSVMTPCIFTIGDYLVKRGEKGDSFYILHEGKVRLMDIVVGNNRYEDVTLHTGDYFGEGALISSETRTANAVAVTKGTAFSIDRSVFQRVLGDFITVIRKAQDRRRLEALKVIREAELSAESMDELASLLVEKSFQPNQKIFEEGKDTDLALYLVREGTVLISSRDGSRDKAVGAGGYFGQEQLLADVKGKKKTPGYTAIVGMDVCVCSVLTLSQCRTVFDTSSMEDVSFRGRTSFKLEARASVRRSINGDLSLEAFKKIKLLGDGQFADVWLVQRDMVQSGKKVFEQYALKIQDCTHDSRECARESVKREAMILQQLHHPFIIDLVYSSEKEDGTSYMLMEAVRGGELWSVIHRQADDGEWISGIQESHAKFYSLILADALAYMHRESIIYRDLKPENVLIDEDGWPVLIDMGFAKHIKSSTFTFCGTPNYLAPEIVANKGHGKAVDHWALGILTYEMVAGENPFYFEGMDQMSLFKAIVEEPFYPLTEGFSGELEDFLNGLLQKDPIERLGSFSGGERDILRHKWFYGLDLDKLRNKEVQAPFVPKISKQTGDTQSY